MTRFDRLVGFIDYLGRQPGQYVLLWFIATVGLSAWTLSCVRHANRRLRSGRSPAPTAGSPPRRVSLAGRLLPLAVTLAVLWPLHLGQLRGVWSGYLEGEREADLRRSGHLQYAADVERGLVELDWARALVSSWPRLRVSPGIRPTPGGESPLDAPWTPLGALTLHTSLLGRIQRASPSAPPLVLNARGRGVINGFEALTSEERGVLLRVGSSLLDTGQPSKAADLISRGLFIDPGDPATLEQHAACLVRSGHPEAAAVELATFLEDRLAADLPPLTRARIAHQLGCYRMMAKPSDPSVVQAFDEAIRALVPTGSRPEAALESASTLIDRGRAWLVAGKPERARADAKCAEAIAAPIPGPPARFLRALALGCQGAAATQLGDRTRGLSDLNLAVSLLPGDSTCLVDRQLRDGAIVRMDRARLLLEAGDLDAAGRDLDAGMAALRRRERWAPPRSGTDASLAIIEPHIAIAKVESDLLKSRNSAPVNDLLLVDTDPAGGLLREHPTHEVDGGHATGLALEDAPEGFFHGDRLHNAYLAQGYRHRAALLQSGGRLKEAVAACESAVQIHNFLYVTHGVWDFSPIADRARLELELKDFDAALRSTDLMVYFFLSSYAESKQPADLASAMSWLSTRGVCQFQRGDAAAAIADFEAGIAAIEPLNPTRNSPLHRALCQLCNNGAFAYMEGATQTVLKERAIPLAEKACTLSDWAEPETLDTLAQLHARCGNWASAETCAERALKLAGGSHELRKSLREHLTIYRSCKDSARE